MDSAIITALAALGGSIVGALGTLASTSVTQRHHDRRELLASQVAHRERCIRILSAKAHAA